MSPSTTPSTAVPRWSWRSSLTQTADASAGSFYPHRSARLLKPMNTRRNSTRPRTRTDASRSRSHWADAAPRAREDLPRGQPAGRGWARGPAVRRRASAATATRRCRAARRVGRFPAGPLASCLGLPIKSPNIRPDGSGLSASSGTDCGVRAAGETEPKESLALSGGDWVRPRLQERGQQRLKQPDAGVIVVSCLGSWLHRAPLLCRGSWRTCIGTAPTQEMRTTLLRVTAGEETALQRGGHGRDIHVQRMPSPRWPCCQHATTMWRLPPPGRRISR